MNKFSIALFLTAALLVSLSNIFADNGKSKPVSKEKSEEAMTLEKAAREKEFRMPPVNILDLQDRYYSFYFGLIHYAGLINENEVQFVGVRGAAIIDTHWAIGLQATTMLPDPGKAELFGIDYDFEQDTPRFHYGGLSFEHYFMPKELMSISIGCFIGYGAFAWTKDSEMIYAGGVSRDYFMVVEPEARIFFNLTRNMRVGFGNTYRFLSIENKNTLKELYPLMGTTSSVIVQFGGF